MITAVAPRIPATFWANSSPPPTWPERRLTANRPPSSTQTTAGSLYLCCNKGERRRTAAPTGMNKISCWYAPNACNITGLRGRTNVSIEAPGGFDISSAYRSIRSNVTLPDRTPANLPARSTPLRESAISPVLFWVEPLSPVPASPVLPGSGLFTRLLVRPTGAINCRRRRYCFSFVSLAPVPGAPEQVGIAP